MTIYGHEHGLKPCPFCNTDLIEAEAFRTRLSRTFVHEADGEAGECPVRFVNVIVGGDRDNAKDWNTRHDDVSRWPVAATHDKRSASQWEPGMAKTSQIEIEISLGWACNHPALGLKSVEDFFGEMEKHGLPFYFFDFSRGGFLTMHAYRERPKGQMVGEYPLEVAP